VARAHGAAVVRHGTNRGPAAARNTGLREADSAIVVFVDADCVATPGWLSRVVAHFDDPRVGAVAPRISPLRGRDTVLSRYEAVRSALDMGPRPELVKPGAPLGFLPSAALAVRVSDLPAYPFDERLRVGEDVDLVWRIVDAGALVRYEPRAVVTHAIRPSARAWAAQIFDYGTSAAELDRRHPGRLTPARLSFWNVAAAGLAFAPWPVAGRVGAAATIGLAAAVRAHALRASSVDPRVAPVIVGKGLLADAGACGHLLRREWWPVGWLALAASARSAPARAAAAAMVAPPVWEWLTRRPSLDLVRYLVLRLIEDAAYGSGVITSAVRSRRPGVLVPQVRTPRLRRRAGHDDASPDQKKPTAESL
jgi:mycofactocin system glycosyltransferase